MSAALAAGCGNVSMSALDAPPSTTDAPAAADARPPDGPTACDPTHAFGAPVAVQGLVVPGEKLGAPRLSPDELTGYLTGYDGTTWDLYVAHRTSPSGTFDVPTPMTAQNTAAADFDADVSADGLRLWFGSSRSGPVQIWVATRPSTLADFGTPGLATGVNTGSGYDGQPFETADGQELWFSSSRSPSVGGQDLWVATWSGSGFADPVHMDALSSPAEDWHPALSADRLTVYFESTRGGADSQGGYDMYSAHRATVHDPFSAPTPIAELDTALDEHVTWLSPDNCRLYYTSGDAILVATRLP